MRSLKILTNDHHCWQQNISISKRPQDMYYRVPKPLSQKGIGKKDSKKAIGRVSFSTNYRSWIVFRSTKDVQLCFDHHKNSRFYNNQQSDRSVNLFRSINRECLIIFRSIDQGDMKSGQLIFVFNNLVSQQIHYFVAFSLNDTNSLVMQL